MKLPQARQLIEALRSGSYKQGMARLKRDGAYCCLGVACEISNLGEYKGMHFHSEPVDEEDNICSSSTSLTTAVRNYFGFRTKSGHIKDLQNLIKVGPATGNSLVDFNDGGASFSEIADFIEENWETL